jgi:hypothetical protein
MLNLGLMEIRLDSASNKVKGLRDPEIVDPELILKQVQDKIQDLVQGDKLGLFTRPSHMNLKNEGKLIVLV